MEVEKVSQDKLVDKASSLIVGNQSTFIQLLKQNKTKQALTLTRNVLELIKDEKDKKNNKQVTEVRNKAY